MDALSYHQFKPQLQNQIHEVYQSLAREHDIMVLEGPAALLKLICVTAISSTWAWQR